MLAGLILRGVSFDFRVKAQAHHKPIWNYLFHFGSLVAAMAQGLMIGRYIVGFESGLLGWLFAALVAICLPMGYMLLGSTWLIMKTTDELQAKAVGWARKSLWLTAAGVGLISLATPYFSASIMQKWFVLPNMIWLSPLPLLTLVCFFLIHRSLNHLDTGKLHLQWHPFVLTIVVFLLAFLGIAYSLFPYLIIDQMTIWQAAAATESLWFIFWGAVIVLPTIILYTIYSYWIFWGKAQPLTYY
jgi:cytochrome d ubiquinol oxidase subunit II